MEYVVQAWDLVKIETIINCWKKTGILPTVNNNDIQQALMTEEILNQENQKAIETLLQTNMNEFLKIDINQYLEIIDLTTPTEEPLTDAKIIQLVLEERDKPKLNDKINQKHHVISTNEAFNSLKTWLQYLEEQENEEIDMKDIQTFRKHMKIMQRKIFESKTQKDITNFFQLIIFW